MAALDLACYDVTVMTSNPVSLNGIPNDRDLNRRPDLITGQPPNLSPNLRRITRQLNARGFALRKRRFYIIEPVQPQVVQQISHS